MGHKPNIRTCQHARAALPPLSHPWVLERPRLQAESSPAMANNSFAVAIEQQQSPISRADIKHVFIFAAIAGPELLRVTMSLFFEVRQSVTPFG